MDKIIQSNQRFQYSSERVAFTMASAEAIFGNSSYRKWLAGNPAKIIKKLDADLGYITRGELFSDPSSVLSFYDAVDREVLSKNSFFKWISSLIWPSA